MVRKTGQIDNVVITDNSSASDGQNKIDAKLTWDMGTKPKSTKFDGFVRFNDNLSQTDIKTIIENFSKKYPIMKEASLVGNICTFHGASKAAIYALANLDPVVSIQGARPVRPMGSDQTWLEKCSKEIQDLILAAQEDPQREENDPTYVTGLMQFTDETTLEDVNALVRAINEQFAPDEEHPIINTPQPNPENPYAIDWTPEYAIRFTLAPLAAVEALAKSDLVESMVKRGRF